MSIVFKDTPKSDHKIKGTSIDYAHGTTCLAFLCKDFACIASDSRSTMGTVISCQTVKKIIQINDIMVSTMAGSAADCQYWSRVVGAEAQLYELKNKRPMTVAGASKYYSNILNQYKGRDLSVGSMIVGYDQFGPDMYYIDSEGQRIQGKIFACGSGSPFAIGVLDQYYREDLTEEEAVDIARRSIYHAQHRDSASGGLTNVVIADKNGVRWVVKQDNFELFGKYIDDPSPLPIGA
ncbi:putative Proteasome subunit beta type-5-B [Monocercomonoides exilis]|uniref:putative Proteasome subunit beta type-5-B n=1 Tax=Monocercomonoides exilis TaxID=2049356 RepID=UPI003559EEC1|nr:putative Proteasome subunit beta type-5-B [Monocercomonoides exilis]|eukprot:MONOS_10484.1-p1 / transcript=MONOS_10484.1 / gene=MONOS_10484 / organism=Monocercomonoides_exilis_PA203 / gene_product=Proteasome subunit beta type-5-B / transcript_product=Proteasome subunit beta type-5-B / location=Mono_scaffold00478:43207-44210(+) / protein_length=236 / sequence_SO=supercontig / SO=protein_coding / is_pseudo=false